MTAIDALSDKKKFTACVPTVDKNCIDLNKTLHHMLISVADYEFVVKIQKCKMAVLIWRSQV